MLKAPEHRNIVWRGLNSKFDSNLIFALSQPTALEGDLRPTAVRMGRAEALTADSRVSGRAAQTAFNLVFEAKR
jgi:hypothetical protein